MLNSLNLLDIKRVSTREGGALFFNVLFDPGVYDNPSTTSWSPSPIREENECNMLFSPLIGGVSRSDEGVMITYRGLDCKAGLRGY